MMSARDTLNVESLHPTPDWGDVSFTGNSISAVLVREQYRESIAAMFVFGGEK